MRGDSLVSLSHSKFHWITDGSRGIIEKINSVTQVETSRGILELWCLDLAQKWGFWNHQHRNKTGLSKVAKCFTGESREGSVSCQFHVLAPHCLQASSTGGP